MKRLLYLTLCAFVLTATVYYFYPDEKLPAGSRINKLVVLKSERRLLAYSDNHLLKRYRVSLGGSPVGHKQFEGDERTPEGKYRIDEKNPYSGFYKNLGISYPNNDDKSYARKKGLSPGGQVKVHGLKNGFGWIGKFHRFFDWTNGCVALTNEEMEEIYQHVNVGTVIDIRP